MRILYVEDNPLDAKKGLKILQILGESERNVDHVPTAEAAERRLKTEEYDVILTDLNLPDSFELQTLDRIHKLAEDTPIVVLTGTHADEKLGIEALKRGAQDYLVKEDLRSGHLRRSLRYAIERLTVERMKREFMSMVTHELNTPISIVACSAENLMSGYDGMLNDEQKSMVEMILRASANLTTFSDDIHAIAKMETAGFSFSKSEIDLSGVVSQAVEAAQAAARKQEIEVAFARPSNPNQVMVRVDGARMSQVIHNLLRNACRYASSKVEIRIEDSADSVRIVVEDDGRGIADADLGRLFERFYRGAPSHREKSKSGSGLGLAVVKLITEAHGGSVTAENRPAPDTGARFSVTLPRER